MKSVFCGVCLFVAGCVDGSTVASSAADAAVSATPAAATVSVVETSSVVAPAVTASAVAPVASASVALLLRQRFLLLQRSNTLCGYLPHRWSRSFAARNTRFSPGRSGVGTHRDHPSLFIKHCIMMIDGRRNN